MIEIYVKGRALDLAPDASVSLVFNNSLFDSDVLQGSFSYPFTLPASPHNRLTLGFPEIIENLAELETEYECLFVYEALALRARLKVREVTHSAYSVNLFTQVGAVADKLKTLKLQDLPLETILLPADPRPVMTLGFTLYGPPPPLGSIINFRVFFQGPNAFTYHPVLWRGSVEQLIQDLAAKINGQTSPQPLDPARVYDQYELVTDSAGNVWEAQFNNTVGQTLDDVHWILVCPAAQWPDYWRLFISPKYYLYDDPYDIYAVEAVASGTLLYLFDNSGGTVEPLDYVLTWGQTFGTLAVTTGFQSISSPSSDTNFRLVLDAMFQQASNNPWPENNYAFPCIYNPGAFDDAAFTPQVTTRPYLNYHVNGGYQYPISGFAKHFYSPQVYVGHVLGRLFSELGVELTLEAFDEMIQLRRLLVYNNTAAVKVVAANGQPSFLLMPYRIRLADHMPECSLGEFLNALRQMLYLGALWDIEARRCRVVNLKTVLASPSAKDWSLLAEREYRLLRDDPGGFTLSYGFDAADGFVKTRLPDLSKYRIGEPVFALNELPTTAPTTGDIFDVDQVRYVIAEDGYYKPFWTTGNGLVWSRIADALYPMTIGGGKTNRQAKASPLLEDRREDEVGNSDYQVSRSWLVPAVSQKLNVRDLNISQEAGLRFYFFWGFHPDSQGNNYPLASSGNVNYQGQPMGELALRYDTEAGIYAQLAKPWLDFLQATKKVVRSFHLTSLDLKNLAQDDKIEVDGNRYLWRSCKVTFPIRKPAEMELWLCDRSVL